MDRSCLSLKIISNIDLNLFTTFLMVREDNIPSHVYSSKTFFFKNMHSLVKGKKTTKQQNLFPPKYFISWLLSLIYFKLQIKPVVPIVSKVLTEEKKSERDLNRHEDIKSYCRIPHFFRKPN